MTTVTETRRPIDIGGEIYYYTHPDPNSYQFEFEDGRYIGQITFVKGTGREKDYWIPGTTGKHVPSWGEAKALLLQEYWRKQATQAAPVVALPDPPPPAPVVSVAPEPEPTPVSELAPDPLKEEWITISELARRLGKGRQTVYNWLYSKQCYITRTVPVPGKQARVMYEVLWNADSAVWPPRMPSQNGDGHHEEVPPIETIPEPDPAPIKAESDDSEWDTLSPEWVIVETALRGEPFGMRSLSEVMTRATHEAATQRLIAAGVLIPPRTRGTAPTLSPILLRLQGDLGKARQQVTDLLNTLENETTDPNADTKAPAPVLTPRAMNLALLQEIEKLHTARLGDAQIIGRLTARIESLEQRLADCQKPAPRKWWQP